MGLWSKSEFDIDTLPEICYLFAGTTDSDSKNKVLAYFDEVLFHKHDIYERYIVRKNHNKYILLFQIFGAIVTADVLKVLKDGGVSKCYFIGYAFGFGSELKVGDIFIPIETHSRDGIVQAFGGEDLTFPDNKMLQTITGKFDKVEIKHITGKSVSVPCVLWHLDKNKYPEDVMALEMEYASFCYFSRKLGIQSGGFFVISDTAKHSLLDDQGIRKQNLIRGFMLLLE